MRCKIDYQFFNEFKEKFGVEYSNMLTFQQGNAKLAKYITTFSLPAGHSCPFAKDCRSSANRITGKITDGEHTEFRCFAASDECVYSNVRKSRWNNFEQLKGKKLPEMIKLIKESLSDSIVVRIHVSGDFFSQAYFDAWLAVAKSLPFTTFYAYTKALPYWIKRMDSIPANLKLVASKGGTYDHLISKHGLRYAEVVFSTQDAIDKGLAIDHDDTHAFRSNKSFALLLHNTQPAGSVASACWQKIKKNEGGYSKKRNEAVAIAA